MDDQIEKLKIEVPEILLSIIESYGGYSFQWLRNNPQIPNRTINAYAFNWGTNSFDYGGFQNRITYKNNRGLGKPFYPEDCSPEEQKKWKEFYILEDLLFGKLILIKTDTGGDNHELYLFEHPQTIAKLTVNLEQYFELLEKTLGLYCWQEYVTEENYKDSAGYKSDETPFTANYGVPEAVLRKIKHDYGREISESMLAFYYQMNGCQVQWTYDNTEEDDFWLEGKINFPELEEVMGGKWKESYLEWNSSDLFKDEGSAYYFNEEEAAEYPEMDKLMKRARLFDAQDEMRDFFIDFVTGQDEPDIYKVNRTDFYKMEIDFLTFIEARIEFAGISGWEYNYIEHKDFNNEFKERLLGKFKDKVKRVLPDVDISRFGL